MAFNNIDLVGERASVTKSRNGTLAIKGICTTQNLTPAAGTLLITKRSHFNVGLLLFRGPSTLKGSGTINANRVTNASRVITSAILLEDFFGTLHIIGTFAQRQEGLLMMNLADDSQTPEGHLSVTGPFILDGGTLLLRLEPGDLYRLLHADPRLVCRAARGEVARLLAGLLSFNVKAGAARPARATASSRSRCIFCRTSMSNAMSATADASTASSSKCCSTARPSPTCSA